MADASRVTLASVAAEAGVSLTTMSKVLNGRTDVAPTTRARLEEHLRRSGYRRRGSGRRNPYVELVLRELRGPLSLEVIEGVRETAATSGLALTLTVVDGERALDDTWLDTVLRRRPAGVIVVSSDVVPGLREKLRLRDIPLVVVEPVDAAAPGVPVVGIAHWSAGVAATRHLIELGHRRIAAITGPGEVVGSHARLDGYRSAMQLAGLPVDPAWTRFGGLDAETGERAAIELLSLPHPPTAIIAAGELQAPGVLNAARMLGVRVPTDLSLVGYDDQPISTSSSPRLTTIHQPMREVGAEAARLVVKFGRDPEVALVRVDLATTLVLRDSTAGPRHPDHTTLETGP
jgi:DNA-binding LacI/PurR family transcriptional regulator